MRTAGKLIRRLVIALAGVLWLCGNASAGGEESLGHHWADRAYLAEMQVQVVAMMAIALLAWVGSWLYRMRRNGSLLR